MKPTLTEKDYGYSLKYAAIYFILLGLVYVLSRIDSVPNVERGNFNPSSDIVLYFSFNSSNPQVKDYSTKGNDGEVSGLLWNKYGGPWNDGAFEFHNLGDKIIVKDSSPLSPRTSGQHFTVSFWLRLDGTNFVGEGSHKDYITFLGKGSYNNGYEWSFREYNESNDEGRNGRISFYAYNPQGGLGAGSYIQETQIDHGWMYITGVLDDNLIKLFKNGELRNSAKLSEYNIVLKDTDSDLYIGSLNEDYPFKGSLDELRIYDRSLTDEEVKTLYRMEAQKDAKV